MKRTLFSVAASLLGLACLVNVLSPVMGMAPMVEVPRRYSLLVTALAALTAAHLAWSAVEVIGRVGLVMSLSPLFFFFAVAGFLAGGIPAAVAAFVAPLVLTLRYGMKALLLFGVAASVLVVMVL